MIPFSRKMNGVRSKNLFQKVVKVLKDPMDDMKVKHLLRFYWIVIIWHNLYPLRQSDSSDIPIMYGSVRAGSIGNDFQGNALNSREHWV